MCLLIVKSLFKKCVYKLCLIYLNINLLISTVNCQLNSPIESNLSRSLNNNLHSNHEIQPFVLKPIMYNLINNSYKTSNAHDLHQTQNIFRSKYILNSYIEEFSCNDVFKRSSFIRFNCICTIDLLNEININCDQFQVYPNQLTFLKQKNIPILNYAQKNKKIKFLNGSLFNSENEKINFLNLKLSNNNLRKLNQRMFDGLESCLINLDLSSNYFGDQLNPIFSTNEFFELRYLRHLNLGNNYILELDANLFSTLKNLIDLNLEGNDLINIPTSSLLFLPNLVRLNLYNNLITNLDSNSFPSTLINLTYLNLTLNKLSNIELDTFLNLKSLNELYLNNNQLKNIKNLGSSLINLEILDLSDNLFTSVPNEALNDLKKLRKLSLAENNILSIEENDFTNLNHLEFLDLSRNLIQNLASNVIFQNLKELKVLNLATNQLAKISESSLNLFQYNTKLESLDLSDNKLLSFPTKLVSNLTNLKKLCLDYNFIPYLSVDMLQPLENLEDFSLAFNLIIELKDSLFSYNQNLKLINLHGNKIQSITENTFFGISENLLCLDLGLNDYNDLPKLNMPKLFILNLSLNQFQQFKYDYFNDFLSLIHLNLTLNDLTEIPSWLFSKNKFIEILDLSNNKIEYIESKAFKNLSLVRINFSNNKLKELALSTFEELYKLEYLDLSNNQINSIKNGAFDDLPELKNLDFSNNKLSSFKGEFFTTRTHLQYLNLCDNQITYLYPNSFVIHRKLKILKICRNRLSYFPTEILNTIRTLQEVDLSGNKIQTLNSNDFANMPQLRKLNLENNNINFIERNVFHNSSLLNDLNLSNNFIKNLNPAMFKNILRLNLDLSNNYLTYLDQNTFDIDNVNNLESLNLANNSFKIFPNFVLRKQYKHLNYLNLARNKITYLPLNSDLLVNLKKLDLSFNPLSDEAINVLLNEPKSLRYLNVAYTNIMYINIQCIEAPFLRYLNLSGNFLNSLNDYLFNKTNLIENLDLSKNRFINNISKLKHIWLSLPNLQILDLSSNLFRKILKNDLENLINLSKINLSNLTLLNEFDCEALSNLKFIKEIYIYNYPTLKNLEIQECFMNIDSKLTKLHIESKQNQLEGHLQKAFSTKLNELFIYGSKLTTISSNLLFGIRSKNLLLSFPTTSIKTIPLFLFLSLSLKCKIYFKMSSSNELLNLVMENVNFPNSKQLNVNLINFQNISLTCDCSIQNLWKIIQNKSNHSTYSKNSIFHSFLNTNYENLICLFPNNLSEFKLIDLELNELVCLEDNFENSLLLSNKSKNSFSNKENVLISTTFEPLLKHNNLSTSFSKFYLNSSMVALNVQQNTKTNNLTKSFKNNRQAVINRISFTKVDTLIAGSVAGVVICVFILMTIFCLTKIKLPPIMNQTSFLYSNTANSIYGQHLYQIRNSNNSSSSCTCLKSSCQLCHNHNFQLPYVSNNLAQIYPDNIRTMTMYHFK